MGMPKTFFPVIQTDRIEALMLVYPTLCYESWSTLVVAKIAPDGNGLPAALLDRRW
jgi:hypothetical protein